MLIGGGISGAIIDVDSKKTNDHAELFYALIRRRVDDIEKVCNNANWKLKNP